MPFSRREMIRASLAGAAGLMLNGCRGLGLSPTASGNRPIIPTNYALAQGHPRVFFRPADLPGVRERAISTKVMDSLLAIYEREIESPTTAPASGPTTEPRAPQTQPASTRPATRPSTGPTTRRGRRRRRSQGVNPDSIERLALLSLLTGEEKHARACFSIVERMLDIPAQGTYFETQWSVRSLALAYDWTHPFMTDDLRGRVRQCINTHIDAAYRTREAVDEGEYLAGHVANEVSQFLLAGIAIGDEGNGQAILARCFKYLNRFLENARFFLETDSFQQSYPYTCTYVLEIAQVFRAMESAFGMNLALENPWFQNLVPWWLYPLRSDETFLRFGDYYGSVPPFDNPGYYRPLAYIATRYRNPYARWFAEQFRMRDELHLLIYPSSLDDTPPARSPDDLPRTHFHERMGIAIARGDWDLRPRTREQMRATTQPAGHTGGTVAAFKCSPYYLHNHCHRDANSIAIYHKGDLALDSGMYDAYETPHWYNYYIRTIAHNSVVVFDPTEKMISRKREYANDGGQRFVNKPHFAVHDYREFLKSDAFKDGKILKYHQADDHSYVCGDASNCYAKSKLKKFLRHVTFILDWPHKSAVSLLVLDEIELAKDGIFPRFLLHSINEPNVDSNTVTIEQGAGRLTANFLTPVSIEKVGGPDKEWFVDGVNYPPRDTRIGPPHAPGAWRIEASPMSRRGRQFQFLTLLTPTDLSAAVPPPPELRQHDRAWVVGQGGLTVALHWGASLKQLTGERKIIVPLT